VQNVALRHREEDRGGFGNLFIWGSRILKRISPKLHNKLKRSFTMPTTATLVSIKAPTIPSGLSPLGDSKKENVKPVSYLSFNATVRRGTVFSETELSEDDYEELGGVEYRALNALLWIVPMVEFLHFSVLP
jgi:hypothetical protein